MSYQKTNTQTYDRKLFRDVGGGIVDSFPQVSVYNTSLNGDFNPGWRDQIKTGNNATTTLIGEKWTVEPGFLDARYTIRPAGDNDTSHWGLASLVGIPFLVGTSVNIASAPDDIVTEVTDRCIRKFIDAADSARSSIELGQDIGEIKETLHAIIHPLQSLREFTFSHLSRVLKLTQTVKHKASLTKMVANTYLEFRFGWNPLAADIGQAYADLTNNNHLDIVPIRASAKKDFNGPFNLGWNTYVLLPNGRVNFSYLVTGSYSCTMKGGVRSGAANGRVGFLQNMQLDLPHFIPTIWDLLPYSWIVDYFSNVGDIFKALCFRTSDVSWGCKTTRLTTNIIQSHNLVLDNVPPGWEILDNECFVINPSDTHVSFVRTPLSGADLMPTVRFSLPLGSVRPWENLAALFVGRQKEISRVASHLR